MTEPQSTVFKQITGGDKSKPRSWITRRNMKIAGWILLAAALATVMWRFVSRPTAVKTVRPQRGELVVEVFGTGTLESKVVVGVSSKIVGKVVEVLVDQADTVTAGQTMARLEDKDFKDAVAVAEAQRVQAEATVAKAKVDLKRQRFLLKKNLIPKADFDAFETTFRVADAQLKTAEASLGVARAKLADTLIVSPESGLIITRNLEVGSTVVPGAPIFRIAASVPWVVVQVDERMTGNLRLGQPARVTFETDPMGVQPGHVERLATEVDRVTEEREVDIKLDHLPENRFLGQRADAYIETARKGDALQVPITVLVTQEGKDGLFVVVDGRARWRPIQLGLRGRKSAEVVAGVGESDILIVSPFAGKPPISNGTQVSISKDKGDGP